MAPYGLRSREAQDKLHRQLEYLCRRLVKVDWLKQLKQPPFTPLVCLGTALAGLLLIFDFSFTPDRSTATIFQAIILLFLSILNTVLFLWEVYILKTRRIRRLLSRIKPFLESDCPWNTQSYPSRSISTLRGLFTVHAHRDGSVVNLPCSLIVQGDVIELYKDVPLPADATVLDSEGVPTATHVTMGCFPPPELFQRQTSGRNIRIIEEQKKVQFVVTQTPIISVLTTTIQKKRAVSVLTQEKGQILFVMNVLCLVTLGVSLLMNVIRYAALRREVGHWTEILLQLQVYTVLPLLQLLFPFIWTVMNLYGTAKIILLTERGFEPTPRGRLWSHFQDIYDVLKKMVVLLVSPSMYPNYRVFHILGSLTSLCSIDKEYVLTDSAPVPEKVFFLTRRQLEDNLPQNIGEQSTKRKAPIFSVAEPEVNKEKGREEGAWEECKEGLGLRETKESKIAQMGHGYRNRLEACVEVNVETASLDEALSTLPVQEDKIKFPASKLARADSDSAMLTSVSQHNTSTSASEVVPTQRDRIEVSGNENQPTNTPSSKKLPTCMRFLSQDSSVVSDQSPNNRLSQALTGSAISLLSQFELVGEILDLSPNHDTTSGLGFDDVNWEKFLGSLKPIGVNCLATSHFLRDPYSWSPSGCSECVRRNLCKTNCVCSLGIEIGVNEFLQCNFTKEVLLFSISDPSKSDENISTLIRRPSASLLTENVIQPHLLSSVLKDKNSGNYLIMSRGSGDMVGACCSDFWDGKDLQPMTDTERSEIEAFFARRHLTSYCVTLAYNPLVDVDLSSLLKQNMALYVPKQRIQNIRDNSPKDSLHGQPASSFSGEQLFSNLLCNQVFLGVVSLQFQPKSDIVHLIEDLESTGIRFVYFTNENEVRGKVFAEKLGLEAGWNCHISLAHGNEDACSSGDDEHEFESCSTSTSSSLNSVINAFQSYVRAKLPKGVHNVRPHLKNVDNVPLLVPLFTDCTVDAIREMIDIMQENGEVVMCLGNAWNHDNLSIYAQADVSLSLIPECASLQCCLDGKEDATLSTSVSDNNFGNPPQQTDPRCLVWPTPLEMATYLNTAMCQLCIHRQNDINILDAVTESRHIMSCIRRGLLFGVGSSLSITILMLAATIFFLPPPLSGGHIFMFLLFSIPLVVLSFLSSPFDPKIKTHMPSRKKKVINEKLLFVAHFSITFFPSAIILLFLFSLILSSICSRQNSGDSDCHPLLGDRNESSLWNGWRGTNELGLLLAQDVTAIFFALHLVTHSIRFIHRTVPLWRLYSHISWPYLMSTLLVTIVQIVYFAVSFNLSQNTHHQSTSHGLSAVPLYVWVAGLVSCVILVFIHEVLRYRDRKQVLKLQRHLKLEFETKLGMNSPF